MIKVENTKLMDKYILRHGLSEIFEGDMKPFMEFFLYKRGEYICRENDNIDYLLFFVKGKAKVYKMLSNGKSLLLCFYSGFQVLGDLELTNIQPAATSVQAIEDTYCIGISFERVRSLLLNDTKFLRFACGTLGSKLNRCSKNSSINLLYPLENRFASYILAAGKIIDSDGKTYIELNESLTEISELLGTSYRHLLRTIDNLCRRGVIIKNGKYLEIIAKKTLQELAADLYE